MNPGAECSNCCFSEPQGHGEPLQCRRFPPILYDKEGDIWLWPEVCADDRCGEWKLTL